jgi:hypothetical protein
MQQHLTLQGIVMLPDASYSPSLASCSFYRFSQVKDWLKGCHFKDAS